MVHSLAARLQIRYPLVNISSQPRLETSDMRKTRSHNTSPRDESGLGAENHEERWVKWHAGITRITGGIAPTWHAVAASGLSNRGLQPIG